METVVVSSLQFLMETQSNVLSANGTTANKSNFSLQALSSQALSASVGKMWATSRRYPSVHGS